MKKYQEIQPPDYLRKYVKCYWILNIQNPNMDEFTQSLKYRSEYNMVFNFGDDIFLRRDGQVNKIPNSIMHGMYYEKGDYISAGSYNVFGISFKSFAWKIISNYDPADFVDQVIAVDLLGREFRGLREKLLYTKTNEDRIQICNKQLGSILRQKDQDTKLPINIIIDEIHNNCGLTDIGYLSDKFNCSVSKLERNFKEYVGITPKRYSNLIRFRNALKMSLTQQNLFDIIIKLGYYDQAHLIKEFKQFTGVSPGKFIYKRKQELYNLFSNLEKFQYYSI